jgi:hypothetical protein
MRLVAAHARQNVMAAQQKAQNVAVNLANSFAQGAAHRRVITAARVA